MRKLAINQAQLEQAVWRLAEAFEWHEAGEGFEFWSDVHSRLLAILNGRDEDEVSSPPTEKTLLWYDFKLDR